MEVKMSNGQITSSESTQGRSLLQRFEDWEKDFRQRNNLGTHPGGKEPLKLKILRLLQQQIKFLPQEKKQALGLRILPPKILITVTEELKSGKKNPVALARIDRQINNVLYDLAEHTGIYGATSFIIKRPIGNVISDLEQFDGKLIDNFKILLYTFLKLLDQPPKTHNEQPDKKIEEMTAWAAFTLIVLGHLIAPNSLKAISLSEIGASDIPFKLLRAPLLPFRHTETPLKNFLKSPIQIDDFPYCFVLSLLWLQIKYRELDSADGAAHVVPSQFRDDKKFSALCSNFLKTLSKEAGIKLTLSDILKILPLYLQFRYPSAIIGKLQGKPWSPPPRKILKRIFSKSSFLLLPGEEVIESSPPPTKMEKPTTHILQQPAPSTPVKLTDFLQCMVKLLEDWEYYKINIRKLESELKSLLASIQNDLPESEGSSTNYRTFRLITEYSLSEIAKKKKLSTNPNSFSPKLKNSFWVLYHSFKDIDLLQLDSKQEVSDLISDNVFKFWTAEKNWMFSTSLNYYHRFHSFFAYLHYNYKVPLPNINSSEYYYLATAKEIVIIGKNEIEKILKSIQINPDLLPARKKSYRIAVIFLYFPGLRILELTRLTLWDVHPKGQPFISIRPRQSETKSGPRNIRLKLFIPLEYQDEIEEYTAERLKASCSDCPFDQPFLADEQGNPFNPDQLRSALEKQFHRAGFSISPHTLRHSAVFWTLLRWYCLNHPQSGYESLFYDYKGNDSRLKGLSLYEIAELFGHSTPKMILSVYGQALIVLQSLYAKQNPLPWPCPQEVSYNLAARLLDLSKSEVYNIFPAKTNPRKGKILVQKILAKLARNVKTQLKT